MANFGTAVFCQNASRHLMTSPVDEGAVLGLAKILCKALYQTRLHVKRSLSHKILAQFDKGGSFVESDITIGKIGHSIIDRNFTAFRYPYSDVIRVFCSQLVLVVVCVDNGSDAPKQAFLFQRRHTLTICSSR